MRTARFARSLTRSRAHGKEVFVFELNASISCLFNPLWFSPSGLGQGLKNIGLPNVGANMVNLASNPLLANAGTGLGANPLLSNTPFANPKVGLNANVNGKERLMLSKIYC